MNLKETRNKKKLLLAEVSTITGIPESTLSKVENGKRVITKDIAVRLAACYGVKPSELMFPDGYKKDALYLETLQRKKEYKK